MSIQYNQDVLQAEARPLWPETVVRPEPQLRPRTLSARWRVGALTLLMTALVAGAYGLAIEDWDALSQVAFGLVALNTLWIAFGAATAVVGLTDATPPDEARGRAARFWRPRGRTAILYLACNEPAEPLARAAERLREDLDRSGLGPSCDIVVLSDTSKPEAIAAESAAMAPLAATGVIRYRRRAENTGRKPGNIDEWLRRAGDEYNYMLVLDADSRMSARRIRSMIRRMETTPDLGLLQTGMGMQPAQTRFGRWQRLAPRLAGPVFLSGLAAWSGHSGNYWGHNALIRVRAFRQAAELPKLSGPPPFGGPVLSHDFIEAALLRRAGWGVETDPDIAGSSEAGPTTLDEFHRRDRRWCQGNLQHIRLMRLAGLHPTSRLHILNGIQGYLAAPIWLAIIVLALAGAVPAAVPWLLLGPLALLMVPKVCGLVHHLARAGTPWRRQVILRATLTELVGSTLIAPLVMVHQTKAVAEVLAGLDCGWKRNKACAEGWPDGTLEVAVALALLATAAVLQPQAMPWLLPICGPLLLAPVLIPWLDRPRTQC